MFPSPDKIEACAQGSTCNKSPGKRDFFSSSGELVNLDSTVSATAGGGVPLGSASHLPVPAGATSGGVPPGSALHLPGAGPASNILEYLPLYAPMDSSGHGKYY